MKILLLSDPAAAHTIKWANSLAVQGLDIFIFGLSRYDESQYVKGVKIFSINTPEAVKFRKDGSLLKLHYLLSLSKLQRLIKEYKPDVLHAHYASSYGLLGALTGFRPFLLSCWGTDVFIFPQKNMIFKKLFEYTLSRADIVFSTSLFMADEVSRYTGKNIEVLPFGIDTNKFSPTEKRCSGITIGLIKTLEKNYGIEYLIEAFAEIKKRSYSENLHLLIGGRGSLESKLKQMTEKLGIKKDVTFTGFIPYNSVHTYHQKIDIHVYPSLRETFGVSALEAAACGKPVIVSDVGGYPEIIDNGETGILIKSGSSSEIVKALELLINDKKKRESMGIKGREKVVNEFSLEASANKQINYYRKSLQ